ncbi:putative transcriptional regulator SOH1 [Catenaria anguillulae PL171]|uniref:Mediator of RNA polymerase II transcription subunit 31 n=1 Tax=Catenaria anguillulae PL171 TaxID=765915 RepID=A0A1Y2HBN1_9FUNG|nr:putative transcriptional regulator SOH1 [Catenaria anguillulae PL171]
MSESPEDAKLRCEAELEFISCLANVSYLHFLATSGYFAKPEFLNYLNYLLYWKRPEYCHLIVYPQALFFLERLQDPSFRASLSSIDVINSIRARQVAHWQTYRKTNLLFSFTSGSNGAAAGDAPLATTGNTAGSSQTPLPQNHGQPQAPI